MGKTAKEVLIRVSSKKSSGRKSGGSKKHGRNLAKCAQYKSQMRRERNKRKRILRHFKFVIKKMKKLNRLLSKRAVSAMTVGEYGNNYAFMLKEVSE